ncbi:TetR family transcriptional regulator [Microtetraspora fusca]|uniref:TetR family transcriptional regulator n=1 Tax=Microtetraspora fusca TaxID=1997 RepID=UPI00082A222A|nr:TetR family transcriptional regulator [Microtetraspora fusca]
MSASVRSRGGRPAVLSKEKIITAALAVIDQEGLEGLSMRRVGALLGVEGMALYRHVPNKSAMLAAVVDHLTAQAATADLPVGTFWTEALVDFGHRYRAVLLRHPSAVPLLATHPVSPAAAETLLAPILAAVDRADTGIEQIQFAFQSVAVFVLGHALAQVGTPTDGQAAQSADASYYDTWFDIGLSALYRGFTAEPARGR